MVRSGSDVTIVGWGNTVQLAEEAADKSGVSCEIIDLRSIVPCDYEAVAASVAKTGRLVVVQEDTRTCGFGSTLIAEITSRPDWFAYFLSAPQLCSRPDVHIGFHPAYEFAALASVDDVVKAVRTTME